MHNPGAAMTTPLIKLETTEGTITVELWPDVAPRTVDHFIQLTHQGFYGGLTFYRVIPDFILQTGDPTGDGTGGCGYTIDPEFNDRPFDKGVLGMARTHDPHSASSQFFIALSREYCAHLDGQYTAFGRVVGGIDVVDRIAATALADPYLGKPVDPPMLNHAWEFHEESQNTPGPAPAAGHDPGDQPT
jgi:cyclophilin family peptidyl-prolyl cis-trans isomerase